MFSEDIMKTLSKIKSHITELNTEAARRASSNPKLPPIIK